MSRLTRTGLWLLPWYPAGWAVFLLWWHFDRDFLFHIIFGTYSRLANLAIRSLGIFGWLSCYAFIVGLCLLCFVGIRHIMRLRRQSV